MLFLFRLTFSDLILHCKCGKYFCMFFLGNTNSRRVLKNLNFMIIMVREDHNIFMYSDKWGRKRKGGGLSSNLNNAGRIFVLPAVYLAKTNSLIAGWQFNKKPKTLIDEMHR